MTVDMREQVARAMWMTVFREEDQGPFADRGDANRANWLAKADAAIPTIINVLAAEADALDLSLVRRVTIPGTYLVEEGDEVSGWLRSFLPSQPEVRDV